MAPGPFTRSPNPPLPPKTLAGNHPTATRPGETLDYDAIYRGESDWRLLPAFDHPDDPAHCLVTGTGLTHRASAENRQAMHAGEKKSAAITDSMRMFTNGALKAGGPRPASSAFRLNGFTKATAPSSAHTTNRWTCRASATTAATKPKSLEFT